MDDDRPPTYGTRGRLYAIHRLEAVEEETPGAGAWIDGVPYLAMDLRRVGAEDHPTAYARGLSRADALRAYARAIGARCVVW